MKGGHPPANIVGGRRVVNRKDRKLSDSIEHSNSESSDEVVREIIDCDLPAKVTLKELHLSYSILISDGEVVPDCLGENGSRQAASDCTDAPQLPWSQQRRRTRLPATQTDSLNWTTFQGLTRNPPPLSLSNVSDRNQLKHFVYICTTPLL